MVTITLSQIAAGVFDGDVDGLLDLIADRAVDEFVRDAMLGTAAFLTWNGGIERDRMERFLVRFYDERMAEEGDTAWIGWLQAISILGLRPLAPLAHQAWDAGYIADGVMERSDFEADLEDAEGAPDDPARFKKHNLGFIEDIIESLAWVRLTDDDLRLLRNDDRSAPSLMDWDDHEPIRNPMRNVGRNDPCPCGSGKKAKKCCLATGQQSL